MKTPFIIGVAGGSGAGKTYFINQLVKNFDQGNLCLISQDNYYKKIDLVPVDKNGIKNFDTLEAIDFDLFITHLIKLQHGETITMKEYTFNNKDKKPGNISLKPAPIIIIEGIFVFSYPKLNELLDLKIFIESAEDDKLKRRIFRDEIERGYDKSDVMYRYEHHVNPAYKKFIEPYKSSADHVVSNNQFIELQISEISKCIKETLLNLK